jgi:hypothetical protein
MYPENIPRERYASVVELLSNAYRYEVVEAPALPPEASEALLTTHEAVKALGIPYGSFSALRKKARFYPVRKEGRQLYYRRSDVERAAKP